MSEQRIALITQALERALSPSALRVEDESHLHAGHAGARSGRGHFRVFITAEAFSSQPLLARHRAVYEAVGALMQSDIHALAIHARAPGESGAE